MTKEEDERQSESDKKGKTDFTSPPQEGGATAAW